MLKSLLQLASASLIAQVVSFLVMPVITRLHSPESLGKYQFFTTVALILSPLVSGSLSLAIKSSPSNYRALLDLKLALQFSLISVTILILLSPIIVIILLKSSLAWFVYYLPLLFTFVYLSSNFQFAIAYLVNERNYYHQSKYILSKSLVANSFKVLFSAFERSALSLVLAVIVAEFVQVIRILGGGYRSRINGLFNFNLAGFKKRIAKKRRFPTYVTGAAVLGILMNWFPILIAGAIYGAEITGYLGLAFMVVNTPIHPFINALQSICFGELAREVSARRYLIVYSKVMVLAIFAASFGLILLGMKGESLFGVVFGDEWRESGRYAFISFVPISLGLVFSPVYSTLNHIFSFQKFFFVIKAIFLVVGFSVTLYIGYSGYGFDLFLISFALMMTINHIVLFLSSLFFSIRRMLHV